MNPTGDETDVMVEQRRRMAEVYRAGVPSDAEIARARLRLTARRHRAAPPLRRVWAQGLAQGFVAGLVTLAAASFVGAKVLPRLTTFWSPQAAEVHASRAPATTDRGAAPRVPARDEPAPAGAGVPPVAEFPEERSVRAPSEAGAPRLDRSRAVPPSPKAAAESAALPRAASSNAPAVDAPASSGAAWTDVAEALAARDFDRAETALKGLSENGDPATRDAASLSRAELWIARGRGPAVRQDVERLSREGRTPLIRRRAAELLTRIHGP